MWRKMRRLNMEFMQSWWDIVTDDRTPMIDEVNTNFEIWEEASNTWDCAGLKTKDGELFGPQRRVREGWQMIEATYKGGKGKEARRHGFFRSISSDPGSLKTTVMVALYSP